MMKNRAHVLVIIEAGSDKLNGTEHLHYMGRKLLSVYTAPSEGMSTLFILQWLT